MSLCSMLREPTARTICLLFRLREFRESLGQRRALLQTTSILRAIRSTTTVIEIMVAKSRFLKNVLGILAIKIGRLTTSSILNRLISFTASVIVKSSCTLNRTSCLLTRRLPSSRPLHVFVTELPITTCRLYPLQSLELLHLLLRY